MAGKTWRSKATRENLLKIFNEEKEVIVFDTETTGLNAQRDRIIQISAIKFATESMDEISRLDLYIKPPFELEPKITKITGITNEFLKGKPTEKELFPEIYSFFGDTPVIAAYNTPFDKGFMEQLYERNGKVFLPKKETDVLEMARDLVSKKDVENHKLGTIAHLYGVDTGLTFHNSMDDVTATARLLKVFRDEYGETEESDMPLITPQIFSMRFWEGFRGFSRIYLNTNVGTFYYDIRSRSWGGKSDNAYSVDEIDMESLKTSALKLAGAATEQEFARFRG